MDMMSDACGFIGTLIGTFLEGEVFLTASIVGAKLGEQSLLGAIIAAFIGTYLQGWFKFYLAKNHGRKLLEKSSRLSKKVDSSSQWYDKNPVILLISYKFLYGVNTVILLLSGLRDMSYAKFALYSAIAALIWLSVFGGLAYFCADALLNSFSAIGEYKYYIIGGLIVLGLIVWYIRHQRQFKDCIEVIQEEGYKSAA